MKKLTSSLLLGATLLLVLLNCQSRGTEREKASLPYASIPDIIVRLQGPMEQRVKNNVSEWIIRAPKANPILLGGFALRDRQPQSNQYYVPWLGEFAGKFLTNSIMFLRMSDHPELEKTVRILIEQLIAQQDQDGYLGPFPTQDRLLTAWDLWGHYHAMTALLMWYERTGDKNALHCVARCADFICDTFLDTGKRMKDVGAHEMNLSIITSLCQIYRYTANERYLKMVREIEKDWEDTGDYFHAGLSGKEFFRTPCPRWESIHCILGLMELYQITGDTRYRDAFMNLWYSARKLEMHNNGSFSSNEQTIGNPYDPSAIETCCTIAWMVMTVDALRLTGSIECADALEMATFNAATALQHPSGSWSTYNTPMDGRREASFHSIVFQSRAGQPELNCCSVNAPRGLGMISEWGMMKKKSQGGTPEIVLNYYGQGKMTFPLVPGNHVTIAQATEYPRDGKITLSVTPKKSAQFTLQFRIPAWAEGATITKPESDAAVNVCAGEYVAVSREWNAGDVVRLDFPMPLRYESGDLAAAEKMSVYRGPLLLAYDQRYNSFECDEIPVVTPEMLQTAKVEIPPQNERAEYFGEYAPWLLATLMVGEDKKIPLVLSDFGSAGMLGTTYASWLPARGTVPPIPACDMPNNGATVATGALRFTWRRMAFPQNYQYTVAISDTPDFQKVLLEATTDDERQMILTPDRTRSLPAEKVLYWKVIAANSIGKTESLAPGRRFLIDRSLPAVRVEDLTSRHIRGAGADGLLIDDKLAGQPTPAAGTLKSASGDTPAEGPDGAANGSVRLDGKESMIVYSVPEFPREEFSLVVDFAVDGFTGFRHSQLVCAWCRSGDDPIRVFVASDNKLTGAVEGSIGGQTGGITIGIHKWYRLAVVKEGTMMTFYLDGQQFGQCRVEEISSTASTEIALGGNPLFTGESEHLACRVANFHLFGKALSLDELAKFSSEAKKMTL